MSVGLKTSTTHTEVVTHAHSKSPANTPLL